MDSAVNGWLIDATGVDVRTLPAIGVVVETSCRYFAELHFPQEVMVGIALEKLGTSSVVYSIGLFGNDESPAAVGRFVHVYVDAETRRPIAIPSVVRDVLGRLPISLPISSG